MRGSLRGCEQHFKQQVMIQQINSHGEGLMPRRQQVPEHFNLSVFFPEQKDDPKDRKCPIEIL
jgi:hypothetical protein